MQYVRCILKCQTDNNVQQLSEPIPTRLKLIIQKKFTNFWNSSKVSLVLINVISFVEYVFKLWYRGSPDSTVFAPPGNHTIEKTVLFGDWFSTKIAIYDFWIFKVPVFSSFSLIKVHFFSYFWPAFNEKLWIFPSIYSTFEQLDYGGLAFKWIF